MKWRLILLLIPCSCVATAQMQNIPVTDRFGIKVKLKQKITLPASHLSAYPAHTIDCITNHLGEIRNTLYQVKGVLLKHQLNKADIEAENQKMVSQFGFFCNESDNCKVAFSLNELFNTAAGKAVYNTTSLACQSTTSYEGVPALVSPTDQITNGRFVKGLKRISIERVI